MHTIWQPQPDTPIISMSESDTAHAVISVEPASDLVTIEEITITAGNNQEWLLLSINGLSLQIQATFHKSPFAYVVRSVDEAQVIHESNDIDSVPCSLDTFQYERLDNGQLSHEITVTANGTVTDETTITPASFTESQRYIIAVFANYTIGKKALQELITCQQ